MRATAFCARHPTSGALRHAARLSGAMRKACISVVRGIIGSLREPWQEGDVTVRVGRRGKYEEKRGLTRFSSPSELYIFFAARRRLGGRQKERSAARAHLPPRCRVPERADHTHSLRIAPTDKSGGPRPCRLSAPAPALLLLHRRPPTLSARPNPLLPSRPIRLEHRLHLAVVHPHLIASLLAAAAGFLLPVRRRMRLGRPRPERSQGLRSRPRCLAAWVLGARHSRRRPGICSAAAAARRVFSGNNLVHRPSLLHPRLVRRRRPRCLGLPSRRLHRRRRRPSAVAATARLAVQRRRRRRRRRITPPRRSQAASRPLRPARPASSARPLAALGALPHRQARRRRPRPCLAMRALLRVAAAAACLARPNHHRRPRPLACLLRPPRLRPLVLRRA